METRIKSLGQDSGNSWSFVNGDCCEVLQSIPTETIGCSIHSPPFASLFSYSDSSRDMGNSKTYEEFLAHYDFVIRELFRVTKPGRMAVVHCMNIPLMKERDGVIGIRPFRNDLQSAFMNRGFIFHSEHVIWKDPLTEATRTKALGLMHKQLVKDSAMSRAGLPDYLFAMRKPGINPEPVKHENGLVDYAGDNAPVGGVQSHEIWRKYASPVWMDIRQSNTLQKDSARESKDEKHICPLQLDVIERAVTLWTNPGDVVLSPFGGIASEGYQAIKMGRKFIGVELKESYFKIGCANLRMAEQEKSALTLL